MADYTLEQAKALLGPERSAKLDASKETFTSEDLLLASLAPVEEAAPVTPTEPVLSEEEQRLAEARRLVEEADAKAKNAPASVADIERILAERDAKHAEEVREIREAAVDAIRTRGAGRLGLTTVEKANALKETGVKNDSKELAEMSNDEFAGEFTRTASGMLGLPVA